MASCEDKQAAKLFDAMQCIYIPVVFSPEVEWNIWNMGYVLLPKFDTICVIDTLSQYTMHIVNTTEHQDEQVLVLLTCMPKSRFKVPISLQMQIKDLVLFWKTTSYNSLI